MSALSDAVLLSVKQVLGITGSAEDSVLAPLIDQAITEVAGYLGRDVLPATYTQEVYNHSGPILLDHFPIASITTVTVNGAVTGSEGYHLVRSNGILWRKQVNCAKAWMPNDVVTVVYEGANFVAPFPAWLIIALTQTALAVREEAGAGYVIGEARKEAVAGVYSVDYGSYAGSESGAVGHIPFTAIEVLRPYAVPGCGSYG